MEPLKGYAFLRGQTRVRFFEPFEMASIIETRLNSHTETTRNVYVLPMFVYYSDAEGRVEQVRLFVESFKANKLGLALSRFARTHDITVRDVIVTKVRDTDRIYSYTVSYAEQDRPQAYTDQDVEAALQFLGHPLLTAVHDHLLWREAKYQELSTMLERDPDFTRLDVTYS